MFRWFFGKPKKKGYYWYKRKDDIDEEKSIAHFDGEDYECGFTVIGNDTPFGIKDFKKVKWYGPAKEPK